MSCLVGAALPVAFLAGAKHQLRHVAEEYIDNLDDSMDPDQAPGGTRAYGGFASPWWPSRSAFSSEGGISEVLEGAKGYRDMPRWWSGANGRFGFAGIARDFNGNVLAGATIRCYRVSDGLPVAAPVTSDANGYFLITTPFSPDTHFLTVHKSGASPYAGASYDNLVGG